MISVLEPYLGTDLTLMVLTWVHRTSLEVVHLPKLAKVMFLQEQRLFRSLIMAHKLMEQFLKLKSKEQDLEFFKWLVGEIIELHSSWKLPYVTTIYDLIAQSGNLKAFKYLVDLIPKHSFPLLRLSVNTLSLAIQNGHLELAKFIKLGELRMLDGQIARLTNWHFIMAIKADSIELAQWILHNMPSLEYAWFNLDEPIIRSSAMYSWLAVMLKISPRDAFPFKWDLQHLIQTGNINLLVDLNQKNNMFEDMDQLKERLIQCLYETSHQGKPIYGHTINALANLEFVSPLMVAAACLGHQHEELMQLALNYADSLIRARPTWDKCAPNDPLMFDLSGDDFVLAFALLAKKNDSQLLDELTSKYQLKKRYFYFSLADEICLNASRGGFKELFLKYKGDVDMSSWEYLSEAIEHDQPQMAELLFVNTQRICHLVVYHAIEHNAVKCLRLFSKLIPPEWLTLYGCRLSNMSLDTLEWILENGFDDWVFLKVPKFLAKGKIEALLVLIKRFGLDEAKLAFSERISMECVDALEFCINQLKMPCKYVDIDVTLPSETYLCNHPIPFEAIQWMCTHMDLRSIDYLEDYLKNCKRCIKNTDSGCNLIVFYDKVCSILGVPRDPLIADRS